MKIIETKKLSNQILGKEVRKTLIELNGSYYVISDNGDETLIFPSKANWEHEYIEVGGGRGVTTEDVLSNISMYMFDN